MSIPIRVTVFVCCGSANPGCSDAAISAPVSVAVPALSSTTPPVPAWVEPTAAGGVPGLSGNQSEGQ